MIKRIAIIICILLCIAGICYAQGSLLTEPDCGRRVPIYQPNPATRSLLDDGDYLEPPKQLYQPYTNQGGRTDQFEKMRRYNW